MWEQIQIKIVFICLDELGRLWSLQNPAILTEASGESDSDDSREGDAESCCSKSSTSSTESESSNRKSSWFLQGNPTWIHYNIFSQHRNPHQILFVPSHIGPLVQMRHTSVQRGMAPDPWDWAWPTISLQEEFQRCWPSEPGSLGGFFVSPCFPPMFWIWGD